MVFVSGLMPALRLPELRHIRKGRLDGKPVRVLSAEVDLGTDRVTLACEIADEGGVHTVSALRVWNEPIHEIKINGHDVEVKDLNLSLDVHLTRLDLEYRLGYEQGGARHEIVLTATAKTFGN